MILKALRGCFFPLTHNIITDYYGNQLRAGVPPEVTNQINELMQLWSRPHPQPKNTIQKRKRGPGNNEEGTDGEGTGTSASMSKGWSKGPLEHGLARRESRRLRGLGPEPESTQPESSRSAAIYEWLERIDDMGSEPVSPPESQKFTQHTMSGREKARNHHDLPVQAQSSLGA